MRPTDAQFSIVDRLASEGQISDEEHDDLTRAVTSPGTPEFDEADEARPETPPSEGDGQPESLSFPRPTLRTDLAANFVGGLGVLAIGLIALSSLGILSWLLTIAGIVLLATTLFDGMRWVTLAGTATLTVVAVIGLAGIGRDDPPPIQAPPVTLAPEDPDPVVPGSLGIHMDEVTEAWNTVEGPPTIARGLTRYNESGEYDTFIYRFGEWGRLAGAYDPGNDAIYALLVAGWLSQDATDQLYLPLCFMVAPYSQECVDSYFEHGLGGGTLDDFTDETHEAEWLLGDHTWRLEIEQNVLTIRVFGADAA